MAVVVKPEGIPTVGDASWTAERMLPYYLAPTAGRVKRAVQSYSLFYFVFSARVVKEAAQVRWYDTHARGDFIELHTW